MRLVGVTLACLLGSGCSNPADVTLHEPGVYKGKSDPLLALEESEGFDAQLAGRFDYQRDR